MIQSMKPNEDHPYELVVGLEVHAQLTTHSKAFSSDPTEYGAAPNTQVSAITLGHPGTLPLLNRQVVDDAIRLGIALNCTIRERNEFARKNYFYADLPKGYQITQHTTPIAIEGFMDLKQADGQVFRLHITRIHMEEDAGKSMHDQDPFDSLIDLNRCGVPSWKSSQSPTSEVPPRRDSTSLSCVDFCAILISATVIWKKGACAAMPTSVFAGKEAPISEQKLRSRI